jgi:hypothetical protein
MSQDMSPPLDYVNPFVSPTPRDQWIDLVVKSPPFNTHLLFQTVENIVFFGFRQEDDNFTGVAITKDNLYTVEAKYMDVVRWNLASDPPMVANSIGKRNEVTKVAMTEGLEVDLKGDIESIQESN